jgi:hypothetical protein
LRQDFGRIFIGMLFECRLNVKGQDGQDGSVHGHADADRGQINTVKENGHIGHAVNGHPSHAHIAHAPVVVTVVPPVRWQIKGHRQALLAGGEILSIELIRRVRRGKAGVLSNRPRLHRVHGRVRTARVGKDTGHFG